MLILSEHPAKAKTIQSYGNAPLSFEPNEGQADPGVKFLARGRGYSVSLTSNGAVLLLQKRGATTPQAPVSVRMELRGAAPHARVSGEHVLSGKSNYFIGNNPQQWRTNIANYSKVRYKEVYPGIDLVYYGNQQQLEYDFVVAPGTDPRAIRMGIEGAGKTRINRAGNLVLEVDGGELQLHKPVMYQEIGAKRRPVSGRFLSRGKNEVTFQVGRYDASLPLIIDPLLSYSTYLGGSGYDHGQAIAVDSSGGVYITGSASLDFPTTPGAYQSAFSNGPFVTKFSASGALVYSTYIGANTASGALAIAVDSSGNAYITGNTSGANFPTTPGAYQTALLGSVSAFVTKLNASGSALVYSTYLGGSGNAFGQGIAVDSSGNAYIAGWTNGGYPTTAGAYQTTFGGTNDAFVTKLNASGTALVYSTYLGGSGDDQAYAVAVDAPGNAYITGYTISTNFPTTPGAYQTGLAAASDVFVTKLNGTGSPVYSTYLGGSDGLDQAYGIAVDSSGNAYVTGDTSSRNFPITPGAYQTTPAPGGGTDSFVAKLNASGNGLVYSTYFGGSQTQARAIAVDSGGSAYVTGRTSYTTLATTPGAYQTTYGGGTLDAFMMQLSASGNALLYSTYIGGSTSDFGQGIALDPSGNIYITGDTSGSFPTTPGVFQPAFGGNSDAFLVKFSNQLTQTITVTSPAPAQAQFNSTFNVSATASSGLPVAITTVGACSGSGAGSAIAQITAASGTCIVYFNQSGNATFGPAPQVTESVIALPISQTISVTTSAPAWAIYNTSFTVAASAASGQLVTISSSGVCSGSGTGSASILITSTSGICNVSFNQPGNAVYAPAPQVTQTVSAQLPGTGVIQTYAGGGPAFGALATSVPLGTTNTDLYFAGGSWSMAAADSSGNIYVASPDLALVHKINVNGSLTTAAGNGTIDYRVLSGVPATSVGLAHPLAVAVDPTGILYIADNTLNASIRKVDLNGVITTVCRGCYTNSTSSFNFNPTGLAVDGAGNLYVADLGNSRVLMITPGGVVTPVAGTGTSADSVDGLPATSASLLNPVSVMVDSTGNVWIAQQTGRVRILSNGILNSFSNGGSPFFASSLAKDAAGNVILARGMNIYTYSPSSGLSSVAANLSSNVLGLAVDSSNNLYVIDGAYLRRVDNGGITPTLGGNGTESFGGDNGPATSAVLGYPTDVAVDSFGNLYIADDLNARVRKVAPNGTITTIAGTGSRLCCSGDNGPAINAEVNPSAIAADASGNVFVTQMWLQGPHNDAVCNVREITTAGIIKTVAGNGTCGYSGDAGLATNASLQPNAVAVDRNGNLFIADSAAIRKVNTSGIITTVAGNGHCGYSGDGGLATSAQICEPLAIALDASGNIYFADSQNNGRIRKVTAATGIITTLIVTGGAGPWGLAADQGGNVYYSSNSNTVVQVSSSGVATRIVGVSTSIGALVGDGGQAINARLNNPTGLLVDSNNRLLIVDEDNNRVRVVQLPSLAVVQPTPTGSNVTTTAAVGSTAISTGFSTVSGSGSTTVTPIDPTSAGSAPGGFTIDGTSQAYEISTTASYSGPITVCFVVSSVTDPAVFATLRILHNENGTLVDQTILTGPNAPNFTTGTICAQTSSLSPFVLAKVVDRTAPAITNLAVTPNPVPAGTSVTISASVNDINTGNSKIRLAQYSLDNGQTWQNIQAAYNTGTSLNLAVTLNLPVGVYPVCIRGVDAAQNTATNCGAVLAVYDPTGGFVTGGGWINSPAGAYYPNAFFTGKANFGFESKYQKGATVPSGNTQFHFDIANLQFASTSYQWLVVSGPQAQFKGAGALTGAINNPNCSFMLTVVDGGLPGGGGSDKFRIKIWDNGTGNTIYDNQLGASDTATPSTALGGGEIIIHNN